MFKKRNFLGENMNKRVLVFLLASVLLFCSCAKKDEKQEIKELIKPNVSYTQMQQIAIKQNLTSYTWMKYVFIDLADGEILIVSMDESMQMVSEVVSVFSSDFSNDDISLIKSGMTVYEVIEIAGMPMDSVTFGLLTLDFQTSDPNLRCRVTWNSESFTVIDVQEIQID